MVNASSTEQPVTVKLEGAGGASHTARVSTLHANTVWPANTIQAPTRIVPLNSSLAINGERLPYVVPPYSIQVVEVTLK